MADDKGREVVLVFCAHPDDEILGVGGTMAKYAGEGRKVVTVICSYGEQSHPWQKQKITIRTRVKESREAAKVVGCEETYFLGFNEKRLREDLEKKKNARKIKNLILRIRPDKIFVHNPDDPHSAHRAVYKTVKDAVEKPRIKAEIYSYEIWNPFKISKTQSPKLVVDITNTFRLKITALKKFKSQKMSLFFLLPAVYAKAILNGLNINTKYAEIFYKEK